MKKKTSKHSFAPSFVTSLALLCSACLLGPPLHDTEKVNQAIQCGTTECQGTYVCVSAQCVEPTPNVCNGIEGRQCPQGQQCVDNPRDSCDVAQGGRDCEGVCVSSVGTASCATDQQCLGGEKCEKPPSCTSSSCPGHCTLDLDKLSACGGKTKDPRSCAPDLVCVDRPTGVGMAADGAGICIKRIVCGFGHARPACPSGLTCVDDPADACDPKNGGLDCAGYCVIPRAPESQCNGFFGKQCAEGLRCLDDPTDECDPKNGGNDCAGVCVP